jgi:16S rRNA (uracil1498-N3)-methyltransferase
MSTPRFHVPDTSAGTRLRDLAAGFCLSLPDAANHHARRVLRLRPGDPVVLFDGQGHEFHAVLEEAPAGDPMNTVRYCARILDGGAVDREAGVAVTLVQALCATEKIDWLVEKCVELGVARLVLAPAERSVVRLEAARGERRLGRWQDIGVAACCQCGRNRLMDIVLAANLRAALHLALPADGPAWLLDPAAAATLAGGTGRSIAPPTVACAVGPEGGFTTTEIALAEAAGYARARLGPRVLRTETAGLVAVTALLALHGEYAR